MRLGEEGTEQFSVVTYVGNEKIGDQKIHDPFAYTTVTLRGWRHAWNILRRGVKVEVRIDGTPGAQRAIMTLDPEHLQEMTAIQLKEAAISRASGVMGHYQVTV